MSRLPLTISTDLPEIFSAGRSENDCAMRYYLSPWTDDPDQDEWMVHVECMPGQVFTFYGDQLRAPGFSTTEDKVVFALRGVCHFLIDHIDNKGLEEVCRSLAEFYAYYRPIEHAPQLPDVRNKQAVICSRSISPAFAIGEEE
jgi:hypothetical protein